MSNPFGNLTNDGLTETEDRLGGGYQPLETDLYTGVIKAFYAGKSKSSDARNVSVLFQVGDKEYRETIYVTNKKGENWFLNKEDNTKKVPLPGFTTIDDICLAATGQALADQAWEEKTIKLYDYDLKKEVPTVVMMAVDVIGKTVSLGIQKILENKGEKQADGSYEPGPETREINSIVKAFHTETKMTMAEARAGKEAGEFWDQWVEKNKGVVRDNRKIKDGQAGSVAGKAAPKSGAAAGAAAAPRKSLFNKG